MREPGCQDSGEYLMGQELLGVVFLKLDTELHIRV